MDKLNKVALAMIEYYGNDVVRINHFLKVQAFAEIIAKGEGVDERTLELTRVAAYTHDIGIKPSEEKYGNASGYYQQIEGPAPAYKMLTEIGYDGDFIERVCYIIAHHHNYAHIEGIDYQIIVEADFIVNMYEGNSSYLTAKSVGEKIFKTETGRKILNTLYDGTKPTCG